jgi:hypothetical protein
MRALIGIALFVLTGCASAGDAPGRSGDRTEIVREEIARTDHRNALELVQNERPNWLRPRGRTSLLYRVVVVVYVDGVRAGGPEFLSRLNLLDVESIRYYDAREAQHRFGVGHTQGALNVITRR